MKPLRDATGLTVIVALLGVLSPASALAAWVPNGTPVCLAPQSQQVPQIAQDGAGGVFIVWQDWRDWNDDIYAQRLGPGGDLLWPLGVAVCTTDNNQVLPWIVSDGVGGAFIAWADADLGTVGAQRLDPGGSPSWTPGGVSVCSWTGTSESFPRCVPDGMGGAIFAWQDLRDGEHQDVYAQRIDASGNAKWTADGVNVSVAEFSVWHPQLVSDGAGGAIITWIGDGIHAQRVDSLGSKLWGAQGVTIRPGTEGGGESPRIVPDGAGGAIISWMSSPNGHDGIYAQRVGPTGDAMWTANGVGLCVESQRVSHRAIASDGAGGAIVTWQDARRIWTDWDVYAQRVSANGTALWTDEGVPICTVDGPAGYVQIASDEAGGAVIVWEDQRAGSDIYSQRVSADGSPLWTENGFVVCAANNYQSVPQIASDGGGGAIMTWCDFRDEATGVHIYAQRVGAGGGVAAVIPPVSPTRGRMLVQNAPNPFNPRTTIKYDLPGAGQVRLAVFDLAGHLIRTLMDESMPQGSHEAVWDGRDSTGRAVGSGTYLARLEFGGRVDTVRMVLVR